MWVYGRKFPDLRHRQQRMFRGDKWHKHKPETFFSLPFAAIFTWQTSKLLCEAASLLLSHDMHLEYGSHFSNVRLLVLKLKTTFKNSMELKGLSRGQFASKWNIFKTFKKSSFSSANLCLDAVCLVVVWHRLKTITMHLQLEKISQCQRSEVTLRCHSDLLIFVLLVGCNL